MKPISPQPHDPLDELLAAAIHGELTTAQRAELDALLKNDPAARAAYQEIQTMHDLLERNHRDAKPDPNFEERMISGVRQKVRDEKAQRESMKESALFLWDGMKRLFALGSRPAFGGNRWVAYATVVAIVAILSGVALGPITSGIRQAKQPRGVFATINSQLKLAQHRPESMATLLPQGSPEQAILFKAQKDSRRDELAAESANENALKQGFAEPQNQQAQKQKPSALADASQKREFDVHDQDITMSGHAEGGMAVGSTSSVASMAPVAPVAAPVSTSAALPADNSPAKASSAGDMVADMGAAPAPAVDEESAKKPAQAPATSAAQATRKLVRDATLDLEVKKFQPTVDAITELAKANGGYLDSSNSQRGGNGKLQGTVVAKVAPDKLDAFLLKLHDLGTLKNQSVSTEDVTKDYYDTEARLTNSRKMETQLQELLKHDTNKVADLLQVERELGRVRGEIEQMQGQLKLYDFQVQYATVTISVAEKDLNKAAAYLLQEHDDFALFVHDVEDAFTQAKAAADTFKAQILSADLQHGSGNSMSATLSFSVPPDQIDGFLAKVKSLGRVDNFKRTTSRVANDGGNSDEPAEETRTDKDNAQVQLAIRADDESPRQVTNLTVASTGDIDAQAQALKDDAVKAGAAVIASSFDRAPDGSETASINFRLPLAKVGDLMPVLAKLGREEALTVSRDDRPGQVAADANAPAEIDLKLHNVAAASFENETPRQQTQLSVASSGNVDVQSQQVKADALKAGFAVIVSTFDRRPDGIEQAQLTFRVPLAQTVDFTETLKKLGKVESFAIQRNDVTGPDSTDPNAPAEISLSLHSEPAMVAENRGVWPTLEHLFGGGVSAFLGSVEMIGVLLAFIAPWLVAGVVLAFVGRRMWLMYQSRV